MKYTEIILKLAFLVGSVYSIKAETVSHSFLITYLAVCFILGVILFFNKKQSYGYELKKREVIMRKIEGIILVAFAIFVFFVQVI
jgi:hypothetical protein